MTSQLVASYSKALEAGDARRYEVILLNYDRNEQGQADYMKSSGIAFPTVPLSKTEKSIFSQLAPSQYLPSVNLLDADGKLLSKDVGEICKRLEKNSE